MEPVPTRHPKAEAEARLGGRYDVRVLEPSPPASDDPAFFADDPAARGEPGDRPLVSPVGDGDVTWDSLSAGNADLRDWCARRWLGGWRRLEPAPAGYGDTRESLRRLGTYVLAPARKAANGKIGLRFVAGGFGTPFFGADEQLRVEGAHIVRQLGDQAWAEPITTLEAAASFAGVDLSEDPGVGHDLPGLGDPSSPLPVDPAASAAVGAWFGFTASVLEQFRSEVRASGGEVSRVQLWPEHFDLAFDDGVVNFGGSPGDSWSAEPYLYVGPWSRDGLTGAFWNAPFGAALPASALLAAPDQRAAALTFLRDGRDRAQWAHG